MCLCLWYTCDSAYVNIGLTVISLITLFNAYPLPSLVPRLSDRAKATKGWGEGKAAANKSLVSTVLRLYVSLRSHRHNDYFLLFIALLLLQ